MAFERGRDRNDRGAGKGRREARAAAAAKHIAEMEARFGREIASSVAGIKEYDGMPKGAACVRAKVPVAPAAAEETPAPVVDGAGEAAPALVEASAASEPDAPADAAPEHDDPAPELPAVSVVAADAVAAIIENGRGRAQFCDLAVLDFASFTSAGGGYERGAWAQEEALCAESFLYNALTTKKDWYQWNRRRNLNCNLYRNRALVVPAVRFSRDKVHAYADVIVAAAPNAARAREEYGVADDALARAMRDRIRFVLSVADDLGHEKLVLGAFGCGAFGWDAEQVATMFFEELAHGGHAAKQVVFAVPRTRFDENLATFEHVLGAFPELPGETYAAVSAAARAAAEASATPDDDDDDDWRKYL